MEDQLPGPYFTSVDTGKMGYGFGERCSFSFAAGRRRWKKCLQGQDSNGATLAGGPYSIKPKRNMTNETTPLQTKLSQALDLVIGELARSLAASKEVDLLLDRKMEEVLKLGREGLDELARLFAEKENNLEHFLNKIHAKGGELRSRLKLPALLLQSKPVP